MRNQRDILERLLIGAAIGVSALCVLQWVREARLVSNLQVTQEKAADLQNAKNKAALELTNLHAQVTGLLENIEKQEQKIEQLTAESKTLAAENKNLRAQTITLRQAVEERNDRLRTYQDEMCETMTERNGLAEQYNQLAAVYTNLVQ